MLTIVAIAVILFVFFLILGAVINRAEQDMEDTWNFRTIISGYSIVPNSSFHSEPEPDRQYTFDFMRVVDPPDAETVALQTGEDYLEGVYEMVEEKSLTQGA